MTLTGKESAAPTDPVAGSGTPKQSPVNPSTGTANLTLDTPGLAAANQRVAKAPGTACAMACHRATQGQGEAPTDCP